MRVVSRSETSPARPREGTHWKLLALRVCAKRPTCSFRSVSRSLIAWVSTGVSFSAEASCSGRGVEREAERVITVVNVIVIIKRQMITETLRYE